MGKYNAEFWEQVEQDLEKRGQLGKITAGEYAELVGLPVYGLRRAVRLYDKQALFKRIRPGGLRLKIDGVEGTIKEHCARLGAAYSTVHWHRHRGSSWARAFGLPASTKVEVVAPPRSSGVKAEDAEPPTDEHRPEVSAWLRRAWTATPPEPRENPCGYYVDTVTA